MDKDFSELMEYLDKKFTNIDERFTDIDGRFTDIDNQFENVAQRFTKIDLEIEDIKENKADKSDVRDLVNAVDAYAKKADTYFQEMVMFSHGMDRHEKWFHQIAEKV